MCRRVHCEISIPDEDNYAFDSPEMDCPDCGFLIDDDGECGCQEFNPNDSSMVY